MFTGIVEEIGEILSISRRGNVTLFGIKAFVTATDIKIGDSISVNGVCLTLIENKSGSLFFETMPETLKITNLGALRIRDKVNLERALKVGDRVSGHFVSGHIDCAGVIRRKDYISGNLSFEIAVPQKFISNIIPKSSVAVDGISLTVVSRKSASFTVYIIPHTLKNTVLNFKGRSDKVNLEFDMLVKKLSIE